MFSYVLDQLIKENFPVTDDMEENADDIVESIETNYQSQYGDEAEEQLLSQLAMGGYDDIEAYREDLISVLQQAEFIKKYVKDNFDEVFDDYYTQATPRVLSLIKVSAEDVDNLTTEEQEKLDEVKKLLNTDKSFGDIASSYSDDSSSSANGNLGIVDTTTDLTSTYGDEVGEKALSLKQGEVSSAIKGSDGYYFLQCESTDKETIKKELETVDVDSPLLSYDEYIVYFAFQSYDLKYNDETAKEAIQEVVDEALKAREEERKNNS